MKTNGLYDIVHAGSLPELDAWLERKPEDLNTPIGDGYFALHVACMFGHEHVVNSLLSRNALVNVNAENASRATPLHLAVNFRDETVAERICRMLLENGAELNAVQSGGQTALHHAVARKSSSLTKLLMDAGADPFLRDSQGRSAAVLQKAFSVSLEPG